VQGAFHVRRGIYDQDPRLVVSDLRRVVRRERRESVMNTEPNRQRPLLAEFTHTSLMRVAVKSIVLSLNSF